MASLIMSGQRRQHLLWWLVLLCVACSNCFIRPVIAGPGPVQYLPERDVEIVDSVRDLALAMNAPMSLEQQLYLARAGATGGTALLVDRNDPTGAVAVNPHDRLGKGDTWMLPTVQPSGVYSGPYPYPFTALPFLSHHHRRHRNMHEDQHEHRRKGPVLPSVFTFPRERVPPHMPVPTAVTVPRLFPHHPLLRVRDAARGWRMGRRHGRGLVALAVPPPPPMFSSSGHCLNCEYDPVAAMHPAILGGLGNAIALSPVPAPLPVGYLPPGMLI